MLLNAKLPILAILFLGLSFASCDKKEKKEANTSQAPAETNPSIEVSEEDENEAPVAFASFQFEETTHDFGTIQQGDSVMHTFVFINSGQVPLVISKARGSCGCTVPAYPTDPIPVGGKGEILVKFNSRGKRDAQNKTVTLTANTDPQNTILTITSFVKVPDNQ